MPGFNAGILRAGTPAKAQTKRPLRLPGPDSFVPNDW
jgi:hypothetical protein